MHHASPSRVVEGLEAIIDAAAGILAEQSLTATLNGMAHALGEIVPFTSLAVFEADHAAEVLVPVYAGGRYVAETLAARPPFDESIAGGVVRSVEMAHVEACEQSQAEYTIPDTPVDEKEAIVVVPLVVGDDVIGTLNVWREGDDPSFGADEAQLIRRFATLAALAYANARQRERLVEQAHSDELTGLANRRRFVEHLRTELAHAARDETPTSLVVFDLDDFKAINDRFGHPAGDAALRAFARLLRDGARAADLPCRIGGEEFAVVLPATATAEAAAYATRVLRTTRGTLRRPDGTPLTASAGVATAGAGEQSGEALLWVADERLLAAKAAGKDRVDAGQPALGPDPYAGAEASNASSCA